MPGHMASRWLSDQRSVASVHSAARWRSPSASQALIMLQVHLPARIGRKPAFDGGQHGLVEVTKPVGELAGVDEEATDGLERLRLEIGRRQPPRQCERIAGEGGRAVEVAAPVRDLGLPQARAQSIVSVSAPRRGGAAPRPAPAIADRVFITWCS